MKTHSVVTEVGVVALSSTEKLPLMSGRSISSTPPPDPCYATFIILFVYGVGNLLPWNFFITANEV